MDSQKRKNEPDHEAFILRELGPLLRLFSSLGITLTLGIVGFFLLGRHCNRWLDEAGLKTHGAPGIALTLCGVAVSLYWCSLRIGKHISKYAAEDDKTDRQENRRL